MADIPKQDFFANAPISEPPADDQPIMHVDMNGLGFNVQTGIFIPVGYTSILADLPYLDPGYEEEEA